MSNNNKPSDNSSEALRVKYLKEKTTTTLVICVISVISVFLITLLLATSVFYNNNEDSVSSSNTNNLPCISNDVNAVKNSTIGVRVLNGSGMSGFATAVSKALEAREFQVYPADSTELSDTTKIYFGLNAVTQAYTLADNFTNVILIPDDRKDGLIDIVIGKNFTELKDRYLVTTSNPTHLLVNPEKCISIVDVKLQSAIEHNTSLVPAYDDTSNDSSSTSDETPPADSSGLEDTRLDADVSNPSQ